MPNIDIRDALLTPKQQKSLRAKRSLLLFWAVYLCGLCLAIVALVIVANLTNIGGPYGDGIIGWVMAAVFGPLLPAGAATAVHYAVTQWHFLDEG